MQLPADQRFGGGEVLHERSQGIKPIGSVVLQPVPDVRDWKERQQMVTLSGTDPADTQQHAQLDFAGAPLAVVLPSLAPAIMLGTRVASSIAMIVALLADLFGTGHGIGRLLVERQQNLDAPAAWGLLLLVGASGYLTATILARVEARILRDWQRSDQ